jgi:hypothetical protein
VQTATGVVLFGIKCFWSIVKMLLEHCCALEIQRHVRGLLVSLYVFKQVHMITMVQACVRRKQARDTAMNRMVTVTHIQSIFPGALVRSRQGRTLAAATKVQTAWRCFSGRFNSQLDLPEDYRSQCLASSHCSKCLPWFGVGETRKVGLDDHECVAVAR